MDRRRDETGSGGDSTRGRRPPRLKRRSKDRLDHLSRRANEQSEAGKLRSALRLFLAGTKGGDIACQLNLGTFYSDGIGMEPNRDRAMYWYRRAYRGGYSPAAHNIGCDYRKENKLDLALAWFERSVNLNDRESNLDIAKIYLQRGDRSTPTRHLKRVVRAKSLTVFEASREEAQRILKRLERRRQ